MVLPFRNVVGSTIRRPWVLRAGLSSIRPACRPFSTTGCTTVVSLASMAARDPVESGDRHILGDPLPASGQLVDRAQREHIRRRDQRGDARIKRQHLGRGRRSGGHRVLEPFDHRNPVPGDTRRGERLAQAHQPVALHVIVRGVLPFDADRTVQPGPPEPHADDADPPVPQRQQMVGDTLDRRRVVDADQVGARNAGLVADHRRHRTGQRRRQVRIVVRHRVDDEPVDRRAGDAHHILGVRPGRHQQQPNPGLVALQGQPFEERDGSRVTEGIRDLFGQQQSDGAGLAGTQRTRDRDPGPGSPSGGPPP